MSELAKALRDTNPFRLLNQQLKEAERDLLVREAEDEELKSGELKKQT